MNNSLKIGIISGLIAGLVAGIVVLLYLPIHFKLGIIYWAPPPPITPFSMIASIEIGYNLIFGIILGAIYSKVHTVIPSRGVLKGLIFGLFLYSIFALRFATISAAYGSIDAAISYTINGPLGWIVFGLVLAALYEVLSRKYKIPKGKKVIEYKMISGLLPGAIAGLLGGMATFVTIFIALNTGFWEWIPGQLTDIGFLISQFGAQTFFHFIWCTAMGLVFPKVYNLIPGKSIIKGLYYGLILYLITEGREIAYFLIYGYYFESEMLFFLAKQAIFLGFTVWAVFGIVIGYLYKPPK